MDLTVRSTFTACPKCKSAQHGLQPSCWVCGYGKSEPATGPQHAANDKPVPTSQCVEPAATIKDASRPLTLSVVRVLSNTIAFKELVGLVLRNSGDMWQTLHYVAGRGQAFYLRLSASDKTVFADLFRTAGPNGRDFIPVGGCHSPKGDPLVQWPTGMEASLDQTYYTEDRIRVMIDHLLRWSVARSVNDAAPPPQAEQKPDSHKAAVAAPGRQQADQTAVGSCPAVTRVPEDDPVFNSLRLRATGLIWQYIYAVRAAANRPVYLRLAANHKDAFADLFQSPGLQPLGTWNWTMGRPPGVMASLDEAYYTEDVVRTIVSHVLSHQDQPKTGGETKTTNGDPFSFDDDFETANRGACEFIETLKKPAAQPITVEPVTDMASVETVSMAAPAWQKFYTVTTAAGRKFCLRLHVPSSRTHVFASLFQNVQAGGPLVFHCWCWHDFKTGESSWWPAGVPTLCNSAYSDEHVRAIATHLVARTGPTENPLELPRIAVTANQAAPTPAPDAPPNAAITMRQPYDHERAMMERIVDRQMEVVQQAVGETVRGYVYVAWTGTRNYVMVVSPPYREAGQWAFLADPPSGNWLASCAAAIRLSPNPWPAQVPTILITHDDLIALATHLVGLSEAEKKRAALVRDAMYTYAPLKFNDAVAAYCMGLTPEPEIMSITRPRHRESAEHALVSQIIGVTAKWAAAARMATAAWAVRADSGLYYLTVASTDANAAHAANLFDAAGRQLADCGWPGGQNPWPPALPLNAALDHAYLSRLAKHLIRIAAAVARTAAQPPAAVDTLAGCNRYDPAAHVPAANLTFSQIARGTCSNTALDHLNLTVRDGSNTWLVKIVWTPYRATAAWLFTTADGQIAYVFRGELPLIGLAAGDRDDSLPLGSNIGFSVDQLQAITARLLARGGHAVARLAARNNATAEVERLVRAGQPFRIVPENRSPTEKAS